VRLIGRALLGIGALAAAAAASGEDRVRVNGACVEVHAVAVPLSDLLDELARRTGVQLTMEGGKPRQRITVDVKCGQPAEVLQGVLEGQGLNYALQMSPDGSRAASLLLIGSADQRAAADPAAAAPAAAASGPRARLMRPPTPTTEPAPLEESEETVTAEGETPDLPPGFVHSPPTTVEGPLATGGAMRMDAAPTEGKDVVFPPGFVQTAPREVAPAKPPDPD